MGYDLDKLNEDAISLKALNENACRAEHYREWKIQWSGWRQFETQDLLVSRWCAYKEGRKMLCSPWPGPVQDLEEWQVIDFTPQSHQYSTSGRYLCQIKDGIEKLMAARRDSHERLIARIDKIEAVQKFMVDERMKLTGLISKAHEKAIPLEPLAVCPRCSRDRYPDDKKCYWCEASFV